MAGTGPVVWGSYRAVSDAFPTYAEWAAAHPTYAEAGFVGSGSMEGDE